jgi:hypothetical protein
LEAPQQLQECNFVQELATSRAEKSPSLDLCLPPFWLFRASRLINISNHHLAQAEHACMNRRSLFLLVVYGIVSWHGD